MKFAFHSLAPSGLALALVASMPALWAAEAQPRAATPSVTATTTPSAAPAEAQARRVVRDKETGKLRAPTEDELKSMLEDERAARAARGEPEPAADKAPLSIRQYSNGMKGAVLGPQYLSTLRAERDASGKLVTKHANPADDHPVAPSKLPTE